MTIDQFSYMAEYGATGLIIILAGCIKIPALELNIWSWIGRAFGRAINGEIMDEVKKIDKKIDDHIKNEEIEHIRNVRQRILRFSDEILMGKKHSKEHFDEVLSDIDAYEKYCDAHTDYINNKAVLSIETIKDVYNDCLINHGFVVYNKKG